MPAAPPRKPTSAKKGGLAPSAGTLKCGAGVAIIAVIIGLSHYFSPSEEDAAAVQPPKAATPAVTSLDDESFEKFLALHPNGVLVDFYTKSCGFCTKLAPEFEKAAQKLKKEGGPPLASVDQDTGALINAKFGIERFPTVLWFWHGQNVLELPRASEKQGPKIVEWTQWAAGAAVQELETKAEFDDALPTLRNSLHAKARLMVAFARPGSEGMRQAFEEAAQRHRATTVFLYIKEANENLSLKSYGGEESKDEAYEGAATKDDVITWVKATLEKAKPPKAEAAPEKADGSAGEAEAASDGKE